MMPLIWDAKIDKFMGYKSRLVISWKCEGCREDGEWLLVRMSLFFSDQLSSVPQASQSITNFRSLLKLMSIESVMPSSHLILCCPLLLLSPIPPSIRVFSNESTLCMRWPKYWSFRFSISPSNEHPGLISFKMDWLDLLAVQQTFKSLFQHYSSKASILRRSAFFTIQLSQYTIGCLLPSFHIAMFLE